MFSAPGTAWKEKCLGRSSESSESSETPGESWRSATKATGPLGERISRSDSRFEPQNPGAPPLPVPRLRDTLSSIRNGEEGRGEEALRFIGTGIGVMASPKTLLWSDRGNQIVWIKLAFAARTFLTVAYLSPGAR
jgi:hypothetical protein